MVVGAVDIVSGLEDIALATGVVGLGGAEAYSTPAFWKMIHGGTVASRYWRGNGEGERTGLY